MQRAIPRAKVSEAVNLLSKKYQIVAAIPKGKSFVFAAVSEPSQVTLDYPTTILPLKKFFLPPSDVIFNFDRKSQAVTLPVAEPAARLPSRRCSSASTTTSCKVS